MKTFFKTVLFLVVIGAFGWTLMYLYKKSQAEPVVFETQTPFVTNIIKKTVATGKVVPRKEIEIKPQVSGIIESLYVEPGAIIKKGDLIAKVKIIPNMVTLNNAESRVRRATINLNNAEREYKRRKELFDQSVIAETEYRQYELEFTNMKEELLAAKDNLQLIREGVTRDASKSTNTLIRSTIAGMVLDVPVEEGNSVIESNTFNSGTTIATVANMGEMIFKGKVDETEVGKIKSGMPLILSVGAIEKVKFNALLEYIAPKGVEENGAIQFEIRAAVELHQDHFIRAGYSANADIVLERRDSVLSIHESLLQFDGDSAYVEVEIGPQEYEKQYIELGLSDGLNIEVLEGLEETTRIKVIN